MPKLVHLTTVHRPSDVRIFQKEAVTLAAHGYEVTLIACAPESSVSRGVRVRALSAPSGRVARMTRTALEAFRAAMDEDADCYHFHDPELIPIGLLLKLRGKRVVYDVHEDAVADVHDKPYLPAWAKPLVRAVVAGVERGATGRFDAIVAATSAIEAKFPAERTTLVRNVPVLDEMYPQHGARFRERPRRVAYVGGLAPFNGASQMVRAMSELGPDADVRLALGGRFSSAADEQAVRALPGWSSVDFHGWVDRARVAELFASARAGLVVYQPTPNIMNCEPNKFFEVLSAGLPLIASDLPHWRRFIEEHECGLVVPPDDPRALARAIRELVDDPERAEAMGRRGRALVEDEYNWERESAKLLALYERLAGPPARRSTARPVAVPA
ncbi:MAG: glycosyltransferase family 4 protein [Gemmatirosa sp.]